MARRIDTYKYGLAQKTLRTKLKKSDKETQKSRPIWKAFEQ